MKHLVRSCLTMKKDVGYLEARNVLRKWYGQSYRIATAYVDKLMKGPAIKTEDSEALRRFSTLLCSCKHTLKEIGYLNKVEYPETLKAILTRLPNGLRQRWRDVADNITENEEREITIEDLINLDLDLSNFVVVRARAANHAVFGDISSPEVSGNAKPRPKSKLRKASTFTTQTGRDYPSASNATNVQHNQSKRKCPLCSSNHWLSQCISVRRNSSSERLAFVRSKELCENCLVRGHKPCSCRRPRFCRVTSCNSNHFSFLHPKGADQATTPLQVLPPIVVRPEPKPASQRLQIHSLKENKQSVQKDISSFSSATGLALVPVRVRSNVAEVESIINGRPITKVSDDPKDCEALTPNHLLLLRAGLNLPPALFVKEATTRVAGGDRCNTWLVSFGGGGCENTFLHCKRGRSGELQKGILPVDDVVFVVDDAVPWSRWPLGRVIEVYCNKGDGLVRSVKVKTKTSILVRPIAKLVSLEST